VDRICHMSMAVDWALGHYTIVETMGWGPVAAAGRG